MSSAISDVGVMRLVKLVPGAVNVPSVRPAPKTSSWATVVVTDPLFGVVLVPLAELPTSSGFAGSRPLYSRARTWMYGAAAFDPPPMKWSDLRYVFWQQGGPRCRGRATSLKRSWRSCARLMF